MGLRDLWCTCMWDSHHCMATLSFLWQSLFDWCWIYDRNYSEQSNNFPLAITLPFGTLSLRGKWMCWDLSISSAAQCKEQIKVRMQLNTHGCFVISSRSPAFIWLIKSSCKLKFIFDCCEIFSRNSLRGIFHYHVHYFLFLFIASFVCDNGHPSNFFSVSRIVQGWCLWHYVMS